MPIKKGFSKTTQQKNFHELRHGKTYAHTAGKFGRKRADKQMVAIVLSSARKAKKKATKAKSRRHS